MVADKFHLEGVEVILYPDCIFISDTTESVFLDPETKIEAHTWAMFLRRAARKLEEIGRGLE